MTQAQPSQAESLQAAAIYDTASYLAIMADAAPSADTSCSVCEIYLVSEVGVF